MAIATMTTPLPISLFPCLLLIPAICFTICHANSNLLCIQSEREALLKFKNHLIDPSNRLSSWVEGGDCCEWTGVVCHNSTGHVNQLNLAPTLSEPHDFAPYFEWEAYELSKLGGKINPSLLERLTCLNLSQAQFQGAIPHNLGNLSKLQYLESKSLQWVSALSSLQYLDLSSANLSKATGWVQVTFKLPSLLELHLLGSGLEDDPSFNSINSSKSLVVLDLSFNRFLQYLSGYLVFMVLCPLILVTILWKAQFQITLGTSRFLKFLILVGIFSIHPYPIPCIV
ncbi:hypothetical protein Gotur_010399 [Gossypium turneri]